MANSAAVPPVAAWAKVPRLVSVVAPVYREERGLARFAAATMAVLDDLGVPFELIFVEDDSPDGSLDVIRRLHTQHPHTIRGLSLSRRFGHQASLAAGFAHARGDVVISIDSDMQHPPGLLPLMLWKWSQGYQIVYTRRENTSGPRRVNGWLSRTFYRVMNLLCDVRLEEGTADFRLMDQVVIGALTRFGERSLFYRGLVNWIGFRRTAVPYVAEARLAGRSSYSLGRRLRLAVDCLFAFSLVPLRFSLALGAMGILAAVGYLAWALAGWALHGTEVPGYTSLVTLIVFMGSLNLASLGVLGAYLGQVHEQVKGRPLYLVKEWIGFGTPAATMSAVRAA